MRFLTIRWLWFICDVLCAGCWHLCRYLCNCSSSHCLVCISMLACRSSQSSEQRRLSWERCWAAAHLAEAQAAASTAPTHCLQRQQGHALKCGPASSTSVPCMVCCWRLDWGDAGVAVAGCTSTGTARRQVAQRLKLWLPSGGGSFSSCSSKAGRGEGAARHCDVLHCNAAQSASSHSFMPPLTCEPALAALAVLEAQVVPASSHTDAPSGTAGEYPRQRWHQDRLVAGFARHGKHTCIGCVLAHSRWPDRSPLQRRCGRACALTERLLRGCCMLAMPVLVQQFEGVEHRAHGRHMRSMPAVTVRRASPAQTEDRLGL